ncbi:hypothetical protein [Variovorax sp. Sphag1AA]|uniref:hypothetical protein n=1 Tax=Variovorax sp. Sphag1AA TaxID=2587027 RepID=UPI001608B59C|nr:hypothetical protein [Variovorax sp. Sphag1AA]
MLAEFTARRNKLHSTDPSSSQFKAVFEAYRAARRKRDGDLLGAYVAATEENMLGVLLTGGTVLQVLDEPYMLPPMSRKAFHEYAAAQMQRVLNGASILSVMGPDGSVISSEEGNAIGSYGRYVFLADKQELDVWKNAHGIATDPYPPEPVSPQDEERKQRQRAEIQAASDHAEAAKRYGQCQLDHGLRLGTRPTMEELRAARQACADLRPPRR